jgi:hypothetical protein
VTLALLLAGVGTFALIGLAGLSAIDRYLLVPSLILMVLAGVAVAGCTMLRAGALRTGWALAAAVVVVGGIAFTADRVNLGAIEDELAFRDDSHAALKALLRDPKVRAGMRCGPVSVPNHRLVPETRWILGAGENGVLARSDRSARGRVRRGGVAIYATNRQALLRYGFTPGAKDSADVANSLPLRGYTRVASTGFYGAYVRC